MEKLLRGGEINSKRKNLEWWKENTEDGEERWKGREKIEKEIAELDQKVKSISDTNVKKNSEKAIAKK